MSLSLMGAAGAATGFARTLPMKGRAVGSSGLSTKSTTSAEQGFALRPDPTSESEDKQIRFFSPEGRIRADSRLVLSHVSTPCRTLPESNFPLKSGIESPFFCIHKTPHLSLSTVFPPKAEALSHRAVRGLYNSASNQNSEGRRGSVDLSVRSICSGF